MIQSSLALAAVVVGVVALGFWLERHLPWGRKVGASLLVIVGGALLSNLGLVPASSPVYGLLGGPVTSLAIVWLLFAVDLRHLKAAGPRMVGAFLLAVAATAAGAVAAFFLFGHAFPADAARLAGVMTGTYSGGSLNFVSVGRAVGLPDSLFAAAAAADNVLTAVWMGATLMLPVWLGRFYPPPPAASAPVEGEPAAAPMIVPGSAEHAPRLDVLHLSVLVALGLGLELAAQWLGSLTPAVPSILWLTTLALAVGQIPWVARLTGAMELGLVALHLFFVVIGIGSRFAEIAAVGIEIFWFTLVVVAVHGLLTFGLARLVRLDAETTAVASQAAVGGPSTAMALAIARNRPELVLPGVMVGLLGYAVGTYAGLGVALLLR